MDWSELDTVKEECTPFQEFDEEGKRTVSYKTTHLDIDIAFAEDPDGTPFISNKTHNDNDVGY